MVGEVAEAHVEDRDAAGFVGEDIAFPAELPGVGEVFVGGGAEGLLNASGGGVEGLEEVVVVGEVEVGPGDGGGIAAGGGEDEVDLLRQRGDVHGEAAEGHGFGVRLPGDEVGGDALEGAAGHGEFDVGGLEEEVGLGHGQVMVANAWRAYRRTY